jgi:hypothetical protein
LLEDETINRAMKQVMKRLDKYIAAASARPFKSLTQAEIEGMGVLND